MAVFLFVILISEHTVHLGHETTISSECKKTEKKRACLINIETKFQRENFGLEKKARSLLQYLRNHFGLVQKTSLQIQLRSTKFYRNFVNSTGVLNMK